MKKRVAYFALGCKLNFSEASSLSADFVSHNFIQVPFNQEADIYIINTCSVTETANRKSRNVIHKAIRKNPEAVIVVTGCYSQLKPGEVSNIEGVDYILGTGEKHMLENLIDDLHKQKNTQVITSDFKEIKSFYPSWSSGERTRSFLKVQDGCDNFCSYCTIPFARGKSRNQSIEATIAEAEKVAQAGFKEVIITGVNIGDFGKSTGENFYQLLKALAEVKGIERYRVSSIEPDLLSDEIIEFVLSHPKFMPHFHIPLQSGSDDMLKLMNRKYDKALFASRIEKIKSVDKDAFIGIDLIVGVPGETDKHFEESLDFVKTLDVSFVHVFTYSEREGTKALKIEPKVPMEIRKERSKRMHDLSEQKHQAFYESQLGSKRPVLLESSKKKQMMYGFTDNYIKVGIPWNENDINTVKILTLDKQNPKGFIESETKRL